MPQCGSASEASAKNAKLRPSRAGEGQARAESARGPHETTAGVRESNQRMAQLVDFFA
jgi:hypothetical protein